jgi:hypothetical protein
LITQVQSSLNNSIQNYPALYNSASSGGFNTLQHKVEMRFTYPIKEIFWTIQDLKGNHSASNSDQYAENKGIFEYNYWNNFELGKDQLGQANFVINGKDLMDMLPANFYRNIQQYQYHNSAGLQHTDNSTGNITTDATVGPVGGALTGIVDDDYFKQGSGVYSYSFALNPEDYQPSGSLNFSKLESAVLKLTLEENSEKLAGVSNGQDTVKTINMYGINYNVLRIMSGMAGLAFIN